MTGGNLNAIINGIISAFFTAIILTAINYVFSIIASKIGIKKMQAGCGKVAALGAIGVIVFGFILGAFDKF